MRLFQHGFVTLAVLASACSQSPPESMVHPWRPEAELYERHAVSERYEQGTWAVVEPCHGLLAANFAWVVADVVSVTEVLESDAGRPRDEADPVLYAELSVVRTIRGEHAERHVVREVCGEWPNGYGTPCFNVYATGDRVIVGLQKIEGTNEGFPTIVLPGMAFVSSDGRSVELFANGTTLSGEEYEALLGQAYDQMAPVIPVCHGSAGEVDLDRCPPESILGQAALTPSRSNAWCEAEPYRPWNPHPADAASEPAE